MSIREDVVPVKVPAAFDSAIKSAMLVFESQLVTIGLSKSQIENQTLEELERSLERVNDAINKPDAFGTVKLKAVGEAGAFAIAKVSSEANYEIGILPLLLERKKQILERISLLKRDEKIDGLRDVIKKVSDETVREKLESELTSLETESRKLHEQSKEVEQSQVQEQIKTEAELAKLQQELFEKRSKVWRSFLERESVATVIGSLLLVIITIALVVAMFTQVPSTDIVNNGFLLILGYFFGQTVSKAAARD
jgi:hypothetical protein